MIEASKLKEICETYGIEYKKLIKPNSNVLKYGEYWNICATLNFFRDEVNIQPKNIEKCPSILYFAVDNIRENWRFLKGERIIISNVESCLHVLSTKPTELKAAYNY